MVLKAKRTVDDFFYFGVKRINMCEVICVKSIPMIEKNRNKVNLQFKNEIEKRECFIQKFNQRSQFDKKSDKQKIVKKNY